jgi:hypothetical protein
MSAENAVRQSLSDPICENPMVSADAPPAMVNSTAAIKLKKRTMFKQSCC